MRVDCEADMKNITKCAVSRAKIQHESAVLCVFNKRLNREKLKLSCKVIAFAFQICFNTGLEFRV